MTNRFIVKPEMGVVLNYFSMAFPNFFDLSVASLWEDMNKICNNGKSVYETFYLFGAFDVLNLGISEDVKELDKMQKIKSHYEVKGVMDYFIH